MKRHYAHVIAVVIVALSLGLVLIQMGCATSTTAVDPVTGAAVTKPLPPVEQARIGYTNTATAYKIAKAAVVSLRRDGLVKNVDWQQYLFVKKRVRSTIPAIDLALKTWKRTTIKPINYDDLVSQLLSAVETLQTIQQKAGAK